MTRRSTWRIAITCVCLAGFGPFVCNDPDVEAGRSALKTADASGALEALKSVKDDAPEVHLLRGQAELAIARQLKDSGKKDEAGQKALEAQIKDTRTALDQAYKLVAELDGELQMSADDGAPDPAGEARVLDLRARIAFSQGLLAMLEERWDDAMVEFSRVLASQPDDEDARWNLELAWHQANPACHKRDDDHEPDDSPEQAGPYTPEKAKDRVLCPGNADWYTVEGKRNTILFVTTEGSIDTSDDESREVNLTLYGPSGERPIRSAKANADGKAILGVTGLREDGVYRFGVSGPGQAEYKYTVRVDVVPPCPFDDQEEENDTFETAKELADGEKGALKACPDDADWYRIKAPKDEARQLTILFDVERAPLKATLYALDGTQVLSEARSTRQGLSVSLEKKDQEQEALVRIAATDTRENTYALKLAPPEDNEGDDQQDQQDQQDQKDQQDNQDQKDQKDQQKQDKNQQAVDIDKLIDAMNNQDKNPQLEKALRNLQVVPQMEDY